MIDADSLSATIAGGESLSVEFKSDAPQISDSDIYQAVVAPANTEGGLLLVGVEDDGTITGAQPRHAAPYAHIGAPMLCEQLQTAPCPVHLRT